MLGGFPLESNLLEHPRSTRLVMAFSSALATACFTSPGVAASITGHVDGLNAGFADGWACVSGANRQVSVAVYVGSNLVGIFPTTLQRTDLGSVCGATQGYFGFQIDFSATVDQQLYGQSNISLYAMADGYTSYLLPPSSQNASNPYSIPQGIVGSATSDGKVLGSITGAAGNTNSPTVMVFAGGPQGGGGTNAGSPTVTTLGPNTYSFSLSSSTILNDLASAPAGFVLPVYGYVLDAFGAPVPLSIPTPVSPSGGGTYKSLSGEVAQSGSQSGITNTIFTAWVSTNSQLSGLSGTVSTSGNDASFSEALIVVGAISGSESACFQANNTSPSPLPAMSRFAAVIEKNVSTSRVTLPIDFALTYGMPMLGGASGTCLATLVSAGYPYLSPQTAKYTDTKYAFQVSLTPVAVGTPTTFPIGIGSEFKFSSNVSSTAYTAVALKMTALTQVDSIAQSASVAAVLGAPAGSGWNPAPTGNWTATTSFYKFPSADCQALGLSFGSPNSHYAVAVNKTPTEYTIPTDATLLAVLPLSGYDGNAIQQNAFTSFESTSQIGKSTVSLAANDCLVALHNIASPSGSLNGNLDLENQSTAYFRY